MGACEHTWKVGPLTSDTFPRRHQVVCVKCWKTDVFSAEEAAKWPLWTDEDYWDNLDAIEGDKAPEIRRLREQGLA
jgi:hypothetical protein